MVTSFARRRAVKLAVADIDNFLCLIQQAKTLKMLSGRQRQLFAETQAALLKARKRSSKKLVRVEPEVIAAMLQCISATQPWFQRALHELT
jgi:hypothetical protein